MVFGAILAGGSGTRMHISSLPKQFLALNDKPIIIHTIEKLLTCNKFDAIFVGVNPSWVSYMNDLLDKYEIEEELVRVVVGGTNRNETIFNIIRSIEEEFGESDDHIIVTHDAVRPFVTLRIIEENIECALKYGACDTVIPATDTIVVSKQNDIISDIPNRIYMYQGQTPQSFNINMLKALYNDLTDAEKAVLTDACNIFVMRNKDVKLVQGEISNLKITTVNDYNIAQYLACGGQTSD